jgi:CBS domain-containing protein
MTREVQTVDEAAPIERALELMAEGASRRLVVTGPGFQVRGVVALDDLLDLLTKEAESVGRVVARALGRDERHAGRETSPPGREEVSRQSAHGRPPNLDV